MAKKDDTKEVKTPKADANKANVGKDVDYNTLITIFETRFDYQAARVVVENALGAAGLEKKNKYKAEEIKKLVDVVPSLDVRTTSIIEGLNALIG